MMAIATVMLAAAFVAAEGGEVLRLFQTTEAKDFSLASERRDACPKDPAPSSRGKVQGQVQVFAIARRTVVGFHARIQVSVVDLAYVA